MIATSDGPRLYQVNASSSMWSSRRPQRSRSRSLVRSRSVWLRPGCGARLPDAIVSDGATSGAVVLPWGPAQTALCSSDPRLDHRADSLSARSEHASSRPASPDSRRVLLDSRRHSPQSAHPPVICRPSRERLPGTALIWTRGCCGLFVGSARWIQCPEFVTMGCIRRRQVRRDEFSDRAEQVSDSGRMYESDAPWPHPLARSVRPPDCARD